MPEITQEERDSIEREVSIARFINGRLKSGMKVYRDNIDRFGSKNGYSQKQIDESVRNLRKHGIIKSDRQGFYMSNVFV